MSVAEADEAWHLKQQTRQPGSVLVQPSDRPACRQTCWTAQDIAPCWVGGTLRHYERSAVVAAARRGVTAVCLSVCPSVWCVGRLTRSPDVAVVPPAPPPPPPASLLLLLLLQRPRRPALLTGHRRTAAFVGVALAQLGEYYLVLPL